MNLTPEQSRSIRLHALIQWLLVLEPAVWTSAQFPWKNNQLRNSAKGMVIDTSCDLAELREFEAEGVLKIRDEFGHLVLELTEETRKEHGYRASIAGYREQLATWVAQRERDGVR